MKGIVLRKLTVAEKTTPKPFLSVDEAIIGIPSPTSSRTDAS